MTYSLYVKELLIRSSNYDINNYERFIKHEMNDLESACGEAGICFLLITHVYV